MSQRLIVLDEAEEELIEAENWYERQLPGLGRAFRTAIDEGMERLVKAPHAASPIVNLPGFIGARRILVKRFQLFLSKRAEIFGLLRLHISIGGRIIGANGCNPSRVCLESLRVHFPQLAASVQGPIPMSVIPACF